MMGERNDGEARTLEEEEEEEEEDFWAKIMPKALVSYPECKLCGLFNEGSTRFTPCNQCKDNFPNARRCSSCGRIYPSSEKFNSGSSYCLSCHVRKMKKKLIQIRESDAPGEELVGGDIQSTDEMAEEEFVLDNINGEGRMKKETAKGEVCASQCLPFEKKGKRGKKRKRVVNHSDSELEDEGVAKPSDSPVTQGKKWRKVTKDSEAGGAQPTLKFKRGRAILVSDSEEEEVKEEGNKNKFRVKNFQKKSNKPISLILKVGNRALASLPFDTYI
jgi:hypothetical protein